VYRKRGRPGTLLRVTGFFSLIHQRNLLEREDLA